MKTEITLEQLEKIRLGIMEIPSLPKATDALKEIDRIIARTKAEGNRDKAMWDMYCAQFGGKPEQFGGLVTVQRQQYEITGVNAGAWKFPIRAKRVRDGREFRLPATALHTFMKKVA